MFKKKKQLFVVLFLVVILSITMTGCDFLNDGSDTSSKTGIEGKLTLKGEPMTNVKIMAGQYITHTNSNGEFEIVTDPGNYDIVMKNLFNEDTKKNVYVEDGKMVEINRSYTFEDLGIADKLFLQEDEYYRPTAREEPDENGDYGIWDNTTIFKIMNGLGARWAYGKITYSFGNKVPSEAKNNITDFFNEISEKLNNVIFFEKVNTNGSIKIIDGGDMGSTAGLTKLKYYPNDYLIFEAEIKINEDFWVKNTYNHEIMHGLGLLGEAHLPEKNQTDTYDGTSKLMYYKGGSKVDDYPSKEVWNSLKLKYSILPAGVINAKWAAPSIYNNSGFIIEE